MSELLLIFVTLLVVFFTLLLLTPIYKHVHINLVDEGFMAYPAWLIYKGRRPYKDFYLGYTPGRATFMAFLFRLFGANLKVARLYYLFLTTIVVSEVVLFSYLFVPVPFLSFFAGIFFLVAMIPRSDIYYVTLLETGMFSDKTIWAIFFMMSFILSWKTGLTPLFFLSGILLGLTFLWGQETGIWALISICFFLITQYHHIVWSNIIIAISGFLIPATGFYLYLKRNKIPISAIWTECFSELLKVSSKNGRRPFPSVVSTLPEAFTTKNITDFIRRRFVYFIHYTRYYLPIIMLTLSLIIIFFDKTVTQYPDNNKFILIPLCYGFFAFLFLYSWPDYSHIVRGLPTQLPVTIYLFHTTYDHFISKNSNEVQSLVHVVFIISAYFCLLYLLLFFYDLIFAVKTYKEELKRKKERVLLNHNGKIFIDQKWQRIISDVISFIKSSTLVDEKILALPADPLIYFLSEKESPVYLKTFLFINPDKYHEQAIAALKREPVKWIIFNRFQDESHFIPHGIKFSEYASKLHSFIQEEYKVETSIGVYDIYKKREGGN